MKQFLYFAFCFLMLATVSCGQSENPGLYSFELDDYYGYVNAKGKIVIPFQYKEAFPFSEGLALVKTDSGYGFINAKGKFIINPIYSDATHFSDGVAIVVAEGTAPTIINHKGKTIAVLKQAENVRMFSDGLAAFSVKIPDKEYGSVIRWGFVDTKGKVMIQPIYDSVLDYTEGLAYVTEESVGSYYIDKNNKKRITLPKDWSGSFFSEGLAAVYDNKLGRYGYINTSGKVVIQPQYNQAQSFSEGLAPVEIGNRTGFINNKGKLVIPATYYSALQFIGDWAPVEIGDNIGLIDKKGNLVVPPQFDDILPVSRDLALVEVGRYVGAIDRKGNYVIYPSYSDMCYVTLNRTIDFENSNSIQYQVTTDYFDVDAVVESFLNNCISTYFGIKAGDSPDKLKALKNKVVKQTAKRYRVTESMAVTPDVIIPYVYYDIISRKGERPAIFPDETGPQPWEYLGVEEVSFTYDMNGRAYGKSEFLANKLVDALNAKGGSIDSGPVGNSKSFSVSFPSGNDRVFYNLDFSRRDLAVKIDVHIPATGNVEVLPGVTFPDSYSWLVTGGNWKNNPWGYDELVDYFKFNSDKTALRYVFYGDNAPAEANGDSYVPKKGKCAILNNTILLVRYEDGRTDRFDLDLEDELIQYGKEWYFGDEGTKYGEKMRASFTPSSYVDLPWDYYQSNYSETGVLMKVNIKNGELVSLKITQYPVDANRFESINDLLRKTPKQSITLTVKDGNKLFDEKGKQVGVGHDKWPWEGIVLEGSKEWYMGEYGNQ